MAEVVDFDEAVDLGDAGASMETSEAAGSTQGKARASDAAGRRLKGRGASGGTQTTMSDKANFETMPGASRSGQGPAKCARARRRRRLCGQSPGR